MDQDILNVAFNQASLKVYRANSHIAEAEAWLAGHIQDGDLCTLFAKGHPQASGQTFFLQAQPFSPSFALAAGDAFHTLSCAFDYISTGIMRAAGKPTTRITFPSHDTRGQLRNSFKAPALRANGTVPTKTANRRIVEAFPAFGLLLLQAIKPYRGGDFSVWEIRKADGMDKHNLVLPVIALGELFDAYLVNETGSHRIKFSGNALPNGVPRAVLTDYGRAKLEIKQKGNPAFSVTFPETTKVFAGDPIIPTLAQCSQFASEAIRIMAKHFGVPTEILAPLDWDGRGASY